MIVNLKEIVLYQSWYEFKYELQKRSGITLLNNLWHEIKPQQPLPWNEQQMREALGHLSSRILKLKKCPRCSGKLVLDRDIDGYCKRCILCSWAIEIMPLSNSYREDISAIDLVTQ